MSAFMPFPFHAGAMCATFFLLHSGAVAAQQNFPANNAWAAHPGLEKLAPAFPLIPDKKRQADTFSGLAAGKQKVEGVWLQGYGWVELDTRPHIWDHEKRRNFSDDWCVSCARGPADESFDWRLSNLRFSRGPFAEPDPFQNATPLRIELTLDRAKSAAVMTAGLLLRPQMAIVPIYSAFPEVARVLFSGDSINGHTGRESSCTATLIAPKLLLSAAHCLCAKKAVSQTYQTGKECAASLSSTKLQEFFQNGHVRAVFPGVGVIPVTAAIPHPEFSWSCTDCNRADLLLLELATSPRLAVRSFAHNDVATGASYHGVGYGDQGLILPLHGQYVQISAGVKALSPFNAFLMGKRCKGNPPDLICVAYAWNLAEDDKHSSICEGDSGGPLFRVTPGELPVLYGVASSFRFARNCHFKEDNVQSDFTKISTHLDWLKAQVSARAGGQADQLERLCSDLTFAKVSGTTTVLANTKAFEGDYVLDATFVPEEGAQGQWTAGDTVSKNCDLFSKGRIISCRGEAQREMRASITGEGYIQAAICGTGRISTATVGGQAK